VRVMRVAPACQLSLGVGSACVPAAERWARLPEEARAAVLTLLARLIARGVLAEDPAEAVGAGGQERGRG